MKKNILLISSIALMAFMSVSCTSSGKTKVRIATGGTTGT